MSIIWQADKSTETPLPSAKKRQTMIYMDSLMRSRLNRLLRDRHGDVAHRRNELILELLDRGLKQEGYF